MWKGALLRGRLPDAALDEPGPPPGAAWRGGGTLWPGAALAGRFAAALTAMQLPRFVERHPSLAGAVLRSMLRLAVRFEHRAGAAAAEGSDGGDSDDGARACRARRACTKSGTPCAARAPAGAEEEHGPASEREEEDLDAIADEIGQELEQARLRLSHLPHRRVRAGGALTGAGGAEQEWAPAVRGGRVLDGLFGAQHGLLEEAEGGGGARRPLLLLLLLLPCTAR